VGVRRQQLIHSFHDVSEALADALVFENLPSLNGLIRNKLVAARVLVVQLTQKAAKAIDRDVVWQAARVN
jgi:hypothetical protein